MAKRTTATEKEKLPASASAEANRASRKAPQPALDADAMAKFAEDFYEFAMAAYENMREGARILGQCEPGTTVKPQSTNAMRQIRKIAGTSTDFVTKTAKVAREQGLDPKPKIK